MSEQNDVNGDDDGGEVELKTTIKKGRGSSSNGVAALPRSVTQDQLGTFAAAIATSGREINVARVHGPGGKDTYTEDGLELPVQCADCPEKLPPESAANLVAAIKSKWGGGIYRAFMDGSKPGEALYPIKVPGKPKPLDEEQAREERFEAERKLEERLEREAMGLGSPTGAFGRGAPDFGGGSFVNHGGFGGGMPPVRPGFTYDPVTRMQIPITPYADPARAAMEKENAELKQKVTLDPLHRKIEDLENRAKQPQGPVANPLADVIQMITLQNNAREKERADMLQAEREERKHRAELEEKRLAALKDREEADRKYREERDREDRKEREAAATKMFDLMMTNSNNLVKIMTSEVGAKKQDPIDGMVKVMQVMQGAKDIMTPPGKSETAELIEAGTAGAKELINSTAEAFKGRGAAGGGGAANNAPVDERLQMLDVLDVGMSLAKSGTRGVQAFNSLCWYAKGRGYDVEKIAEKLKVLASAQEVDKLKAELKSNAESALVPEQIRKTLGEAVALLDKQENAAWLLEVGEVAARA